MQFRDPVVGTRRLAPLHIFYNLITRKSHRVKGRCNICGKPIFSEHRKFAGKGLCLYCAAAYTDGLHDRLVQVFNSKLKNWTLIDTITGAIIARNDGEMPFTGVKKAEQPQAVIA